MFSESLSELSRAPLVDHGRSERPTLRPSFKKLLHQTRHRNAIGLQLLFSDALDLARDPPGSRAVNG